MFTIELFAIFVTLLYLFYKRKLNYFNRLNIPHIEPNSILENVKHAFKDIPHEMVKDFYLEMKSKGHKYAGYYAFFYPIHVIIDGEYIKNVLIKDFSSFDTHGVGSSEEMVPLNLNLFTARGEKWKMLRMKVTPSFTIAKVKKNFNATMDCATLFGTEIARLAEDSKPIDIYNLTVNFTINIVALTMFGLDINTFKNPNAVHKIHITNFIYKSPLEIFKATLALIFPTQITNILGIRTLKSEGVDFFRDTINKSIEYRKNNGVRENDFMQTLIDSIEGDKSISLDNAISLTTMMFLAGHETTSLTVTHCLFELAKREDIQDKVRNEITQISEITFDSLSEMKYTEKVINETLRMYPPSPMVTRKASQSYKMPGTNTIIEKDSLIIIPTFGIHRDPDIFPDPDTFNPDRLTEKYKTYFLPFGGGPRICPAIKMAMMSMKIALVTLLKNYKIKLDPSTPTEIKFNPKNVTLSSKSKILICAEKIN